MGRCAGKMRRPVIAPANESLSDSVSRILEVWDRVNPREDDEDGWSRRQARAGSAWTGILQYRSYVGYALEDRDRLSAELLRLEARGQLVDEEAQRLIPRVHYTIESFFVFGKILLDRVALAIEATFGNAKGFRPSHRGVLAGLGAYAVTKGIPPPPNDLIRKAREFEETLTRFRDHQITHKQNVRHSFATMFKLGTGEVDVIVGIRVGTEREAGELSLLSPPPVARLAEDIDGYLAAVTEWVEDCLGRTARETR